MFYTSRRVAGEEACRIGLADVLVPQAEVRAAAQKLAAEIAENSPLGVLETRATMRAGLADTRARSNRRRTGEANAAAQDCGLQGRRRCGQSAAHTEVHRPLSSGAGDTSMTASRVRLFSGPLSMFGAKVQIAVLEKGIDFELVMVPFETKRRMSPSTPRWCASIPSAGAGADRWRSRDVRFDADLRVSRGSPAGTARCGRAGAAARARARQLEHTV